MNDRPRSLRSFQKACKKFTGMKPANFFTHHAAKKQIRFNFTLLVRLWHHKRLMAIYCVQPIRFAALSFIIFWTHRAGKATRHLQIAFNLFFGAKFGKIKTGFDTFGINRIGIINSAFCAQCAMRQPDLTTANPTIPR